MQNFDVIIVGAGPAGAQCARYIAENSDYSVLLLDKTHEIGQPKKSTAGTFQETMDIFKLPKKVVMCRTKKAVFEGPNEQTVLPINGYVLEFGLLKKFLVERAVHSGAELKIGAEVAGLLMKNKRIAGIEYDEWGEVNRAGAKIVVDATGPSAVLASQLGLRTLSSKNHWIGVEFEMDGLKLKYQNAMLIKFNRAYAPGGYSWIFSTGRNHGKVGNCWNQKWFASMGGRGSQVFYLQKWIKEDARLSGGVALEMHGGDAYVDNSTRRRSCDNFMIVGDAGSAIQPLFGEGIRYGMFSGNFAAQTAINALKKGNTSAGMLKNYDKLWNSLRSHRRLVYFLSKRLYNLSNDRLDKVVRNLRKFDSNAVRRLMSYDFTFRDIRKLIV